MPRDRWALVDLDDMPGTPIMTYRYRWQALRALDRHPRPNGEYLAVIPWARDPGRHRE